MRGHRCCERLHGPTYDVSRDMSLCTLPMGPMRGFRKGSAVFRNSVSTHNARDVSPWLSEWVCVTHTPYAGPRVKATCVRDCSGEAGLLRAKHGAGLTCSRRRRLVLMRQHRVAELELFSEFVEQRLVPTSVDLSHLFAELGRHEKGQFYAATFSCMAASRCSNPASLVCFPPRYHSCVFLRNPDATCCGGVMLARPNVRCVPGRPRAAGASAPCHPPIHSRTPHPASVSSSPRSMPLPSCWNISPCKTAPCIPLAPEEDRAWRRPSRVPTRFRRSFGSRPGPCTRGISPVCDTWSGLVPETRPLHSRAHRAPPRRVPFATRPCKNGCTDLDPGTASPLYSQPMEERTQFVPIQKVAGVLAEYISAGLAAPASSSAHESSGCPSRALGGRPGAYVDPTHILLFSAGPCRIS